MDERLEKLEAHAQSLLRGQISMQRDIKCIVDTWAEFKGMYGEYLKLALERERDRAALRKAIIEKTILGAVIAVVIFIANATWEKAANYAAKSINPTKNAEK